MPLKSARTPLILMHADPIGWEDGRVNAPPPEPEGFYERVGRIVSMTTQLQGVAGSVAHYAAGGSSSGHDWIMASGGIGKVAKAMDALTRARPEDLELQHFWLQVQLVVAERNNIAHAILVRDDPGPHNGNERQWWLIQTRDGLRREMPTAADTDALLQRMADLSRQGIRLAERVRDERSR